MAAKRQLDTTRTSDFLFEAGSVMTTVFGAAFVASLGGAVGAAAAGFDTVAVPVTAGIAAIAGLLALHGVGLLCLSAQVEAW